MPGQPVRARAHYRNVPRRFTLENRRLPLALPQSFSRPRNAHVFAVENFPPDRRPFATGKRCPLVQKLWTPTLPCGRPWKTKNDTSESMAGRQQPVSHGAAETRRERGSCSRSWSGRSEGSGTEPSRRLKSRELIRFTRDLPP